jgi:putative salt-induced outer membrane protein
MKISAVRTLFMASYVRSRGADRESGRPSNERLLAALILMLTGLLLSATSWAHEEKKVDEGPWSGLIAAGYTEVSGNTESASFRLNAEINYAVDKWNHQLLGRAVIDSSDATITDPNTGQTTTENQTTAESYKAAWESNYDLSERTYLFGLLEYNKNRFSSYERQIYEFAGIGRHFIVTDAHKLNGQVGFGAGQSKLTDGTDENEFTTRLAGDYTWKFSENASFKQTLSMNIASSNTYTESLTELRAGVIGDINLVLSYGIQHNSDVLPGTDKKDTYTTISVEYAF